jgi:hypothetical protein
MVLFTKFPELSRNHHLQKKKILTYIPNIHLATTNITIMKYMLNEHQKV